VSISRIRGAIPPGILLVDCRETVINEEVERWKHGEDTKTDGEGGYNKWKKTVTTDMRNGGLGNSTDIGEPLHMFHLFLPETHE
jgi:hypothetical protein